MGRVQLTYRLLFHESQHQSEIEGRESDTNMHKEALSHILSLHVHFR